MPVVLPGGGPILPGGGPLYWRADNAELCSVAMPETQTELPIEVNGARVHTHGPTLWGYAYLQMSRYASGTYKTSLLKIKRNGITLGQIQHNGLTDNTSGNTNRLLAGIPPYPRGAVYELTWENSVSPTPGTAYTARRYIYVPADTYRSDVTQVDAMAITSNTRFEQWYAWTYRDLLRIRTRGPTNRGSAAMQWSLYCSGYNKSGTHVYLLRESDGVTTVLYDSGSLSPGDSTSGTSYNTGTIVIPAFRKGAVYRWVGYTGPAYLNNPDSTNMSWYVGSGHIIAREVRNR